MFIYQSNSFYIYTYFLQFIIQPCLNELSFHKFSLRKRTRLNKTFYYSTGSINWYWEISGEGYSYMTWKILLASSDMWNRNQAWAMRNVSRSQASATKFLMHIPCIFILFLLQPTNARIYNTIFSLYTMFTPICFNNSVSSSGSFKLVLRSVT